MNRIKLKKGGRNKALLGADGAIMAAATLVAAGMQTAATVSAAKQQAEAVKDSAQTNAKAIKEQSENDTALQKESIQFTREQNQENRDQQRDIQMALQMMAGQQNVDEIMEANKAQVKYGGKPKRRKLKKEAPVDINNGTFKVTDGGDMIPIATYPEGGILYEAYGNDHNHYHKTPSGKYKTGVGIKFFDNRELEVEGNQNSNQGEYLYVNPNTNDVLAISKHNLDGFNPVDAVNSGIHPVDAFNIQQQIKAVEGYNDDGTKSKRKSIKKLYGGANILLDNVNLTQSPINGTAGVAAGVANVVSGVKSNTDNLNVAKFGTRIKLKNGGRHKAGMGWKDVAGATYSSIGNLVGAGINSVGSYIAGKQLSDAYNIAGETLANAYLSAPKFDVNSIRKEDYAAPHAMAVIRGANTNINPQLSKLDRQAAAETKAINRGTLSSAARQQRLASVNDRKNQATNELYSYKNNADEQIKQGNAARLTQTMSENANRDAQANQAYASAKLQGMMFRNEQDRESILGAASARSDAQLQSGVTMAKSNAAISQSIANSINAIGNSFSTAINTYNTNRRNDNATFAQLGDIDKLTWARKYYEDTGDDSYLKSLIGTKLTNEDFEAIKKGTYSGPS